MSDLNSATVPETTMYAAAREQEKNSALEKLGNLVRVDSPVLFSSQSVFPFMIFPQRIILEKTQITIVEKIFFGSQQIHSIPIAEVGSIEVSTNMFFGNIKIFYKIINQPVWEVKGLKKSDALRARRIIEGLLISKSQNIDISSIPTTELSSWLEKIGSSKMG
jgi:hypothetical protein